MNVDESTMLNSVAASHNKIVTILGVTGNISVYDKNLERITVIKNVAVQPVAISYFENYFYIGDWAGQKIITLNEVTLDLAHYGVWDAQRASKSELLGFIKAQFLEKKFLEKKLKMSKSVFLIELLYKFICSPKNFLNTYKTFLDHPIKLSKPDGFLFYKNIVVVSQHYGHCLKGFTQNFDCEVFEVPNVRFPSGMLKLGENIYVCQPVENNIKVFDLKWNFLCDLKPPDTDAFSGFYPFAMTSVGEESELYVCGGDSVVRIDVKTRTYEQKPVFSLVGCEFHGIDLVDDEILIANRASNNLVKLSART